MCKSCYEKYSLPLIVSCKTLICSDLIEELYTKHGAGGYGHCIFDDYNIEDHHIESSIENCKNKTFSDGSEEDEVVRLLSLLALTFFKELSDDERYSSLWLRDTRYQEYILRDKLKNDSVKEVFVTHWGIDKWDDSLFLECDKCKYRRFFRTKNKGFNKYYCCGCLAEYLESN